MEVEISEMDCVAGLRRLPAEFVDVVVTSPPYNIDAPYRSYVDRLTSEEYLAWCSEWGGEVRRVLKGTGSFFLNLSGTSRQSTLPFELVLRLVGLGFHLQNTIHWVKSISLDEGNGQFLSRGHFKPIQSTRYLNRCHEYVFHLTKSNRVGIDRLAVGVPYEDKSNITRWRGAGRDLRCRGDVWFVPYETIRSRDGQRPHPATFPVKLAEMCIALHGVDAPVVLDPFLGLGSSAKAAQRAAASRFLGFEIDAEYVRHARARLEDA
jgi:site-specific DNA-methyltransferase (adenine-specific)